MKKIIIILIVIFVIGGGAFWYFNKSKVDPVTGQTTSGFKSFFSFGDNPQNSTTNSNSTDGEVLPNDTGVIDTTIVENKVKLKQLTDYAVAGLATFMDTRPIQETTSTAPLTASPEEVKTTTDTTPIVPKAPVKKVDPKAKTTKVVAPVVELPKVDIVPALRFTARSNGHIYEQYLDTLVSGKISNTTIPTIHEAIFAKEGQFIMYRYFNELDNTIQSFFGTLGGASSGSFLPDNITSVTTAPSGSQFFYLVPLGNDIAGYIGSFTESKKTQIFTSAFTEWIPEWAQPNTIFLTTKPSYLFKGSVYALNKLTNGFTKIFGGINGLTTLASPYSNLILYTDTSSGYPVLGVYNITNHTLSSVGVNTITDKCVWSQDGMNVYCGVPNNISSGQYPDMWYQGLISFNDSIVKINLVDSSSTEIINTEDISPIDATNLTLSPDEKTLFMINKKDSTLWSLDLN